MSNKEKFKHYTVLKNETVDALDCQPGLVYIDATLGGGGHTKEIAKRIQPDGMVLGFDVDAVAIENAEKYLEDYKDNVTIVKASYNQIPQILRNLNIEKITGGICFDLGASYYQLTSAERGFSFMKDAPLDMRFDADAELTAYDVVNNYSQEDLARIFFEYGEERFSRRIARKIVEQRKIKSIHSTVELAELVKSCMGHAKSKIHPATRVFQAIRIEVNQELKNIENTLKEVITLLEKNARIAVISFHSLEDRIVKRIFKQYSSKCNCPPLQMVCNCEPNKLELITRKPIIAGEEELKENPPSRSAKLRIAKRV